MKPPTASSETARTSTPRNPRLLAEIHALLDRISVSDLESLAASLRGLAALAASAPCGAISDAASADGQADSAPRALIIDADPKAAEATADIVTSMGHGHDCASAQTEARALLAANRYAYILLDLDIPVRPRGNHARIQNGVNLLMEIRANAGAAGPPVIATLAEHRGNTDIAVWMMRKGAADFLRKPFTEVGYTLEKAISDALVRAKGRRPTASWPGASGPAAKRGDRAAAIEALKGELIEHIRSARSYALAAADSGKCPDLLPRPLRKDLSRRLGLRPYAVTRCFSDSKELRVLWDVAGDLDQVMKFGR